MLGMSLIWLLLVMALFFIIGYGMIKFAFKGGNRGLSRKKTMWLIGTYIAILLLANGIYFFMYVNHVANGNGSENTQQNGNSVGQYYDFVDLAMRGELESTEGIIKQKEWSFEHQGDRLMIESPSYYELVIVEQVPEGGSLIEVSSYKTTSIFEGIDVTDRISPPDFIKKGEIIVIEQGSGMQRIEGVGFTRGFVNTQFSDDKNNWHEGGSFNIGQQLIYIRIPDSITVIDRTGNIQFIGQE